MSWPWPVRPTRSALDTKQTSRRRRASHQIGVPVRCTPSRHVTGGVGASRGRRATPDHTIAIPRSPGSLDRRRRQLAVLQLLLELFDDVRDLLALRLVELEHDAHAGWLVVLRDDRVADL